MYSISNMYMAAALLAYGADLEEIDKTDKRRQKFRFGGNVSQVFIQDSELVILRIENPTFDDIWTYFVGEKLVFPPSFVDSIRRIKAAIHDN